MSDQLRNGSGTSWGLSRFSRSEHGTVPFQNAQIARVGCGGTDGEDGPTDAAGAVLDAEIAAAAGQQGLDAADYLARNDAYHFFRPLDALIKTGPTHTNVCDVRVVVVDRRE